MSRNHLFIATSISAAPAGPWSAGCTEDLELDELDATSDLALAIPASARRYGIPSVWLSRLHVALLGGVLAVAGCAIDDSTADETVATTRDTLVLTTGQGWGRDANGVTTTLRVCWDGNSILGADQIS